jgi:polygalacturonase
LRLDAGAVLLGSQDEAEFPLWGSKWEGDGVKPRHAALFSGEGLENVSLTGRGVIDARGKMWWAQRHSGVVKEDLRPFSFRLVDSKNVLIEGVTFRNSPMWTVTPLACENVNIHQITIQNPPDSPNTDGINPESCRNVHISDCLIDVGDDCVTLKCGTEDDGRREHRPTENVTITNCTMMHGHGGVVIGSEMSGSVRNVTISNCVFVGTDRGLRFKSRRGRGGVVEDVRADNIVMDGVLVPIAVNLFYAPGARGEKKITDTNPWPVDGTTPRFRRLRFSNITAKNIKACATFVLGLPEMPVEDVAFDNCSFWLDPASTTKAAPEMFPNSEKVARGGVLARGVKGLSLRDVEVTDQVGPAVSITDGRDVILADLVLRTPPGDGPLIRLENVPNPTIRNCPEPNSAPAQAASGN